MKRILTISLIGLTVALFPPRMEAQVWTLEQAVAFALEKSPDSRIANHRIRSAEATVRQAKSGLYPRVDLRASYMQTNTPMMAFGAILNQGVFDFGLDFNDPGRVDNLNLTGLVGYNIYSGGKRSAGQDAADAGLRASELDSQSVRDQLAYEVVNAYFNIIKAREVVASTETAVAAFEENLKVAKLKFEAGTFLKTEVLNLEVQLAQTRENHLGFSHQRDLAERVFLNLLGLDSGQGVTLAPDDQTIDLLRPPPSVDLSTHPDLLSMKARTEAAEAQVRMAKGDRMPIVNAFGSYQLDHGWRLDGTGDSWMAGVSVDFNIFDGAMTREKIHEAEARHAVTLEGLRKMTLGIDLQVEQAKLALAQTIQRLEVTKKVIEQAEESAVLSRARFEQGVILSSDLINIETSLTRARMRRAIAIADERVAVAQLRRALGLQQFPNPSSI
ncbi:MAG: TolC family protein [Verrucomicrobia bacterium]|nr:MAG: TolC family protein [Verrucomicrobiota bacterium]